MKHRERFQDYPIKIGLISRFRTKKQQTETIKGLKERYSRYRHWDPPAFI